MSTENTTAGQETAPIGSEPQSTSSETAPQTDSERSAFDSIYAEIEARENKQPRDEAGRFAKTGQEAEQQQTEQTGQPEKLKAPERWTAERKAVFDTLDPNIQQVWLDQHKDWERGYQKKVEELSPQAKFAESIRQSMPDAIRNAVQNGDLDETKTIREALQLADALNSNPTEVIQRVLEARGIDPKSFIKKDEKPSDELTEAEKSQRQIVEAITPLLQPIMDELKSNREKLAAYESFRAAEIKKSTETTIDHMRQETDESGTLRFPYFDRVIEDMAALIEADPRWRAMDPRAKLEKAYETAVWSNSEIRDEINKNLVTAEVEKSIKALEREKSNGRLNAAQTVKPTTSAQVNKGNLVKDPNEALRSAFEEAIDELGATF